MKNDPADLSKLHDIILPEEVSWWPLAPGWIVLLAIGIITISYYSYRALKKWRSNAYRRDAILQLAAADTPTQIAEVLRRTALAIAPREEIAELRGKAWTDWLFEYSKSEPSESVRESLTRSIYDPSTPSDLPALRDFAHSWISQHKRPC